MRLTRFDLIDKLNAWTMEQEITCVNGEKKTVTVIAMEDVNQALDEIMNKNDTIHIVSECQCSEPTAIVNNTNKCLMCGKYKYTS